MRRSQAELIRTNQASSLRSTFGAQMAAIARALARVFPTTFPYVGVFKQVALFCGAILLVAILLATYGLDLSAGFF
jgi:hypothetical protein